MGAILALLRLSIAALLVYAGTTKLWAPVEFAEEIANYRLLPSFAPWLAATLPSIEVVIGACLLVGSRALRSAAALAAVALLVMFTGAVASVWLRGIDVRCGCFGTGGGNIDGLTVLRDVLFVGAALLVFVTSRRALATVR